MTVDPRSLIYPAHDDRDATAKEDLEPQIGEPAGDRRTGTDDELKELDRAERRKK